MLSASLLLSGVSAAAVVAAEPASAAGCTPQGALPDSGTSTLTYITPSAVDADMDIYEYKTQATWATQEQLACHASGEVNWAFEAATSYPAEVKRKIVASSLTSDLPAGAGLYIDSDWFNRSGVTDYSFGIFSPEVLTAGKTYSVTYRLTLPRRSAGSPFSFSVVGQIVQKNACFTQSTWCVGVGKPTLKSTTFVGEQRQWSARQTTCWSWRKDGSDPTPCGSSSGSGSGGGGSVATPRLNKLPVPVFTYSRKDGAGRQVVLNGGSSYDPDGSVTNWQWLRGGKVIATGKTPTVSFGTATAPSVKLVVTDNGGATAETSKTLSLPNRPPVITRPNPADGTVVGSNRPNLSATTSDPDGDALTYTYRITGPSVDKSSGPVSGGWTVPPSTLDPGGAYSWTVTVTDPDGLSASTTRSLRVAMLPVANDVVSTASGKGYWQVASDGGVFSFGDAQFYGSVPGLNIKLTNIMGMARTPSGRGYWLVGTDGGVFSFGDAAFYGSLPGQKITVDNVVGMVPTKSGKGYWLVGSDGGVFSFGDAPFYGSMGGKPLNAPVTAIAATPSGKGYWLVARDGGVFTFGDAPFFGSMGGKPLNAPVVDMDLTPTGQGYWMTAEDGGVFTFGDAPFYGSMAGQRLNGHINGLAATPSGKGYWLNGCDGGVFTFGDAPFFGAQTTYECRGT